MTQSLYDFCIEQDKLDLLAQWDEEKNGELAPRDIARASNRKVWWLCEKGHEYCASVAHRVLHDSGCPYCNNKKVLAGYNDLATAVPQLAAQWHPTKNGDITPQMVTAGSQNKAWWICEKGHVWEARIYSRTAERKHGCPICSGKQVLPGYNDLASQRPDIAKQWHPTKNGELRPQDITPRSNRKVWWVCEKGHEYRALVSMQKRESRKDGCPYCAGKQILIGFNDLATTQPKIAAQWHPELNGELTPQMVTAGCNKKAWWICEEGHVWETVINNRAGKLKHGCPVCAGKRKVKSVERYARIMAEQEAKKAKKPD